MALQAGDHVKFYDGADTTYQVGPCLTGGRWKGAHELFSIMDHGRHHPRGIVQPDQVVKVDKPTPPMVKLPALPQDQVYVGYRNGTDWSDGRMYFQGVDRDGHRLLQKMTRNREDYVRDWYAGHGEICAIWTLEVHDINTGEKVRDVNPRR